jgi:hypothetical protein
MEEFVVGFAFYLTEWSRAQVSLAIIPPPSPLVQERSLAATVFKQVLTILPLSGGSEKVFLCTVDVL